MGNVTNTLSFRNRKLFSTGSYGNAAVGDSFVKKLNKSVIIAIQIMVQRKCQYKRIHIVTDTRVAIKTVQSVKDAIGNCDRTHWSLAEAIL